MSQFDRSAPPPQDLPHLCYGMAYFMIPKILFSDAQRMIGYFTEPTFPPGMFLFVMYCRALGIDPSNDDIRAFKSHVGELSEGRNYYIVEYPTPTDTVVDPTVPNATLAPFFSAILQTQTTGDVRYYILGQRPFGGTTLRAVTSTGANANLGEGPTPNLEAFLQTLRQRG